MEKYILDSVTFEPDADTLARRMHVGRDSSQYEELLDLLYSAQAVAKPKAMYKVGYIESKGDNWVVIDGIRFTSRVLRVNLDKAHRVFEASLRGLRDLGVDPGPEAA